MRRADREILDRESLREIIDAADACRLGFAAGGEPYIVTLNFGYEWESPLPVFYFHCARAGRKLDMMRANPRVCLELDVGHVLVSGPAPCEWGMKFSSILGYGELRELVGDGERRNGLDRVMSHYGRRGEGTYAEATLNATTVLELRLDEMAGKRKA